MTTTATDTAPAPAAGGCTHDSKTRLLGYDGRIWECSAPTVDTRSGGCGARFVEGEADLGEARFVRIPNPVRCDQCLDGYAPHLLPDRRTRPDRCDDCGATSMRTGPRP